MFGTSGRTRTDTLLKAGDFESPVYTNFTTLASQIVITANKFPSSSVSDRNYTDARRNGKRFTLTFVSSA